MDKVKNILYIICMVICLSSCTIASMPRPEIPFGFSDEECGSNIDCIVDMYDAHITGNDKWGGDKFPPCQGYRDVPIREMIDNGWLDIIPINPFITAFSTATGTIMPGLTYIEFNKYGGVNHATVMYDPMYFFFTNTWLIHELNHAQCYTEQGVWLPIGESFTPEQQEVLKEEFGPYWKQMNFHWVDTEFYKTKDPIKEWQDYDFVNNLGPIEDRIILNPVIYDEDWENNIDK